MIDMSDIHSLTDFQRRTREHIERLKATGRPSVLTVNGRAQLVVQAAASYQRLLDALNLAESNAAIAESLVQARRGDGQDAVGAIENVRTRLNLADGNPTMHIRAATLDDAEVMIDFNRRLAAETEDKTLDLDRLAAGVRAALTTENTCLYFVAESHGRVVGQTMVTFEWSDWRNGWFWWIQSVYVHPDARRRGVFRALHDHVRRLARRREDICGIRLYVEHENHAAQETYRGLGMVPSGHLVYEEDWSQ